MKGCKNKYKKMKKIIFISLMLNSVILAGQTNYYIDSDGGNDANNGLTPATAWQNLGRLDTTTVFNYGDSILFQRGDTWTGRLSFSNTYHPNGLVLGAYGTGAKPLINANGVGASQPSIKVFQLQSIKISYIEINIGSSGVYGIWADNTDSLYVDSCSIHDNDYTSTISHAIVVTDQPWVSITNNELYNLGMEGFFGGVKADSLTPCIISGNHIYNCNNNGTTGDCLQLNLSAPSVHIFNNIFDHRNPNVVGGKGPLVLTQDTGFAINVRIYDNICYADSNDSYGISTGRAPGALVYNNYVYGTHNEGTAITGAYDTASYNQVIGFGNSFSVGVEKGLTYHIYNNYIKPRNGVPQGRLVVADDNDSVNTWYFKNNICDFPDRFLFIGTYELDYNIYNDPSGTEPNSIYNNTVGFWDTLFVDTFNINPNSLAVDAGTNVGLSFDYQGDPVPYNSIVDIGVDEYTPSNNPCDTTTLVLTAIITSDTSTSGVGAIDLSVSGGVVPYVYSWSSGESTQDISNKVAGNYTVTVTDNNSCLKDSIFTIPNFNPCDTTTFILTATITPDTNLSSVGAIDLSVSGGRTPYTYLWSSTETTQDITSKLAGNYTVTVTDFNSCTKDSTFTIPNYTTLDTIDWAVDTLTSLWAGKINTAIIRQNIITEPDLDTIILNTDTPPIWCDKINFLIKVFSNDTILYGTDNLEIWRTKTNTVIKLIE